MTKRTIATLCCIALLSCTARSATHIIHNLDELTQFATQVNSGTSYSGTTVILDADIDFSGQSSFTPIGSTTASCFQGVFDGNGHKISGLSMSATADYNGFFGYAKGATIRNLILDSSCSINYYVSSTWGGYPIGSSTTYNSATIGAIVGGCEGTVIENCVNMANISCSGTTTQAFLSTLHMGGIVGDIKASTSNSTVRNCVNYGAVKQTVWTQTSYLGGIAAYCTGSGHCNIQNNLNYGEVSYSYSYTQSWSVRDAPSSDPKPFAVTGYNSIFVGGIVGYTDANCVIENSYSAGEVYIKEYKYSGLGIYNGYGNYTASKKGGILGSATTASGTVEIRNCYYTANASASGENSVIAANSFKTSEENSTPITSLNSYATSNGVRSKWIHNPNNKNVTFVVDGNESVSYTSTVILAPDFESESRTFLAWYNDASCTSEFTDNSVDSDKTLYGAWGITVTLIVSKDGAAPEVAATKKVIVGGTYGFLDNTTINGYVFNGWTLNKDNCNSDDFVTSSTVVHKDYDHSLYACFTEIPGQSSQPQQSQTSSSSQSSSSSTSQTSSSPKIKASPSSFSSSSSSKDSDTVKPIDSPTYVEIVFSTVDLNESDVKDIIKKFVSDDTIFEIEAFNRDESTGETNVVIKFADPTEARNFIDGVQSSGFSGTFKKSIVWVGKVAMSISPSLNLFTLLYALV